MERLKQIKFLENAEWQIFSGDGHSVDEKFLATINNKQYFVKLTNNYINPNLKDILEQADIPHAPILDIGKVECKYYIIQEYTPKDSLKKQFNIYSKEEIYTLMYNIATKFSTLRTMFPDKTTEDDEYESFLSYLFQMLNTFHTAYKNSKTFSKANQQTVLALRNYLIENIKILKNCPCIFGHPDIHPGNFFIDTNSLQVIDYDSTGYYNIAIAILWGLLSDTVEDMEKYLSFTSGYLNGLFNNNIPTSVIEAINIIFAFIMIRYILKFLNKNQCEKAEKYVEALNNYFKNNKVNLSNRLKPILK